MFKLVVVIGLLSSSAFAFQQTQQIRLWPNGAPGSRGTPAPDVFSPAGAQLPQRYDVVNDPSVFVFLPPKEIATGAAVVVLPGGGHRWLNMKVDGWPVAAWLNNNGIAAFVVTYRLAKAKGSHYTIEGDELSDAMRAMRLVRSRAKEWDIDPHRIGLMGLSAGGEVAALVETRFDAGNPIAADPIDRVDSRPGFSVIVYPGDVPSGVVVPANAPPAFLVCADDDRAHVQNTVNLYIGLHQQNIPAELHIYATGKHGFAMKPVKHPVAAWPDRLRDWMVDEDFLKMQGSPDAGNPSP